MLRFLSKKRDVFYLLNERIQTLISDNQLIIYIILFFLQREMNKMVIYFYISLLSKKKRELINFKNQLNSIMLLKTKAIAIYQG